MELPVVPEELSSPKELIDHFNKVNLSGVTGIAIVLFSDTGAKSYQINLSKRDYDLAIKCLKDHKHLRLTTH